MKRWQVKVTRTFELDATDPFSAGERALSMAQRQKAWPEELRVEIELIHDYEVADDHG